MSLMTYTRRFATKGCPDRLRFRHARELSSEGELEIGVNASYGAETSRSEPTPPSASISTRFAAVS